jgi:hypothetical protein
MVTALRGRQGRLEDLEGFVKKSARHCLGRANPSHFLKIGDPTFSQRA